MKSEAFDISKVDIDKILKKDYKNYKPRTNANGKTAGYYNTTIVESHMLISKTKEKAIKDYLAKEKNSILYSDKGFSPRLKDFEKRVEIKKMLIAVQNKKINKIVLYTIKDLGCGDMTCAIFDYLMENNIVIVTLLEGIDTSVSLAFVMGLFIRICIWRGMEAKEAKDLKKIMKRNAINMRENKNMKNEAFDVDRIDLKELYKKDYKDYKPSNIIKGKTAGYYSTDVKKSKMYLFKDETMKKHLAKEKNSILYSEEGVNPSLKGFDKREALKKLLGDVQNKKIDKVVFFSILDLGCGFLRYGVVDYLIENNITIVALTEEIDTSVTLSYLKNHLFVTCFMMELEKKMLKERQEKIKEGIKNKKEKDSKK